MNEKSIDLGEFKGFPRGTSVAATDIVEVSAEWDSRIKITLVDGSFVTSAKFGTPELSAERLEASLRNLRRVWRQKESAAHEADHEKTART